MKFLAVKEWFVFKNGMENNLIEGIVKVTEKAVQVVTGSFFGNVYRTNKHWVPKSCLEIIEDNDFNAHYAMNYEGNDIEEAIKCYIKDEFNCTKSAQFNASLYM